MLLVWTLIETRLNNDITREGTFTQTRAWLSCDVKLTKQKIDPSENGVRWTAVATCKNFGVSPALGVSFFARIQASPRGKTLAEHMEEFAKSTVDSTVHGEAVFPNGGGDYTYFVVMDNADIEDTLKRDNYQTIFPILYGCVNYRIPGSQVIHQTMFGYYVLNVVAGRRYLPGPSYPEWLLRPMEVTRPGIVKAT